ncbi:MAG: hypothetical protein QMD22_11155, partial [archaeon]|nr:hypothetical protein [archaeon]
RTGREKMELWQILLGIAFLLAILTFTYPLVIRIRRKKWEEREKGRIEKKEKSREEEVMEILREIEDLKKRMEREGIKLTSISDVFLVSVQILSEIRLIGYRMEGLRGRIEGLERGIKEEMGDTRALILFSIATISALNLTIISLL